MLPLLSKENAVPRHNQASLCLQAQFPPLYRKKCVPLAVSVPKKALLAQKARRRAVARHFPLLSVIAWVEAGCAVARMHAWFLFAA